MDGRNEKEAELSTELLKEKMELSKAKAELSEAKAELLKREAEVKELLKREAEVKELLKREAEVAERERLLAQKEDAKLVFGWSNPLSFPARRYTKELLELNYPFVVQVSKRPSWAIVTRTGRRRMDREVILYALRKVSAVKRLQATERVLKRKTGEMATRPWHWGLVEILLDLTKPSPQEIAAVTRLEKSRMEQPDEDSDDDDVDDRGDNDCGDDDDEADFLPHGPLEREDLNIEFKRVEDDQVDRHETDEDEEDDGSQGKKVSASSRESSRESDYNDMLVKVRLVRNGRKWAYVLVIECKHTTNWTEHSVFQALKYACDRGLLNLQAGVYTPVHVMVVTELDWSYAVVDVYGCVPLVGGDLVYEGFAKYEEQRFRSTQANDDQHFIPSPRKSELTLQKQLFQRRAMLRRNCKSNPLVDYPDGTYLVADVYIDTLKRVLPQAGMAAMADDVAPAFHKPGVLLFYETLFRIIIGNKVLRWKKKDVRVALQRREELSNRCQRFAMDDVPSDLEDDERKDLLEDEERKAKKSRR